MKKNLIFAFILAAAAVVGCKKEPVSTDPAELKSIEILAADNSTLIKEDIKVDIFKSMAVRTKEGFKGKQVVLTLTAGENDVITIDGSAVNGGKATVDGSYPVDINVKNSKSGLSATYELKFGKLDYSIQLVGQYAEANCEANMGTYLSMAVDAEGTSYFSYLRKATIDGTTDAKNSLSVAKWNGKAVELVGNGGFVSTEAAQVAAPITIAVSPDGIPTVMYKGGNISNFISVQQYKGGTWDYAGTSEGVSTKFTSTFGTPTFYFNPATKQPGFFYTSNVSKDDPNFRNYADALFNGSEWQTSYSSLGTFPKFDGNSAGMFYMAACHNTEDAAYAVTTCNLHGYYVYKMTDGAWTNIVTEFCPEGEEYGIPTNLSVKSDAKGNIYVLAASSKEAKEQVYKLNEEKKALEPYGTVFQCTAGGSGSIAENMAFGVSPSGSMVCVLDNKFYALNANKQWEPVADMAFPGTIKSNYFMEYTSADSGVFMVISQDADKKNKVLIYSFSPVE